MKAPKIALTIDDTGWATALPEAPAVARRAARAALRHAGLPAGREVEVSLVLSNDRNLRILNRDYRGQDKPTNVLSFPSHDPVAADAVELPLLLGDVVLALQTLLAEARAQNKGAKDHLAHLVVHGVLHLAGFDHEIASEAEAMESLEVQILHRLGIADPYAAPGAGA